ncbi:MAG: hypothetical protein VX498_07855 [Myxococcota bacterium]|nr:hypothetical protein [Myxococcota bacterium]
MGQTAGVLLVAATLCVGCAPSAGDQQVGLGSSVDLRVSNSAGTVSLLGGGISDTVFLSYEVRSDDGSATVADVELTAGPSGETFVVSVATPGPDVWVDLLIGLPDDLPYGVATGSGDIFLESLAGGGSVLTSTGVVSGGGLSGNLAIVADWSEVYLEAQVEEGDALSVEVGEGPIVLTVPSGTDAAFEASAAGGLLDIQEVPFSGEQTASTASGVLGVGGEATINLTTGLGNISVYGTESL